MEKMRILIIADEVWNNQIFGNNVLSNWFEGFDADFAEIYCTPGRPLNSCCEKYFQLTDSSMVKSIFGRKAGKAFNLPINQMQSENGGLAELQPQKFYKFMKRIANDGVRIIRDLIWLWGRYDTKALKKFIDDFNPDIVYCPRLLTPKLRRLEKVVSGITNAPFVAFTADDECSLKEVSYSPVYWIRRLVFRYNFKKHVSLYKHYFTFSQDQANEYKEEYGVETSTLYKCGNFIGNQVQKVPNSPLKLVYAGRLYCNRWKTLEKIGGVLDVINKESVKAELYIYTNDDLSTEQKKALSADHNIHVMGGVSPERLVEIYRNADIALHVESFEKKYKYKTRISFSTKIIDLMASSCAILAICWDEHTGYKYLKENDAAFCVSDYNDLLPTLTRIVSHPSLIQKYAEKAWICGKKNHSRNLIQNQIYEKFSSIIQEFN